METEQEPSILYKALRSITPLRAAVRPVRKYLGRYRPQAWRLEGRERVSGVPLVIVFAGQLQNKNYIAHFAFAGSVTEKSLGRRWLWTLVPHDQQQGSDGCDLRIVELYERQRRWLGAGFQFFVPIWVASELNLPGAVAWLHRSKNAKDRLRRMRKNETTYEVTHSRDAFEYYYSNMYVPYVKNRHGNRAFLVGHKEMMEKVGGSELFLIKVRGERVAGTIFLHENGGVRVWSTGIKDGDSAHVKAGAIKALDYLTFQYLAERGYKTLHMGLARPFLLDPVLKHKKGFRVRISDHTKRYFSIRLTAGSAGASAFGTNNPFIYEKKGTYRGAIFIEPDLPLSPDRLRELYDAYHMEGLSGLSLFDARAGGEKQLAQIAEESLGER